MSQQQGHQGRDQTDRVSGDRVEGSLTDGGSLPGVDSEGDRSFGAGQADETGEMPDAGTRGGKDGPPNPTAGQTSGEAG